jgi:hypothetical protein
LRQDGKTDFESVQRQEIAGALRLELEPHQLQQDLPSSPMAEHHMPTHQQLPPSSLMPEFLNLTSPECASRRRLLVYSRWHERRQQVPARGPATPLKGLAAAMDVVDPASLETPFIAASNKAPDPSAVAIPLQVGEIVGMAVPQATPLVVEQAPSIWESFIAKLAQQTTCILAAPASIKRCSKTKPAGDTLAQPPNRRS